MIELEELTQPAVMPVSRADLMAHLRLGTGFAEPSGEEDLIDRLIVEATAEIEARTGLALIARECRLTASKLERDGRLTLPVGPVSALASASIQGLDSNETFDTNDLTLDPGVARPRLSVGGAPLPALGTGERAVIDFTAGFGVAAGDVPATLREAVLLLAAHRYGTRGQDAPEPAAIGRLVARHRAIRL